MRSVLISVAIVVLPVVHAAAQATRPSVSVDVEMVADSQQPTLAFHVKNIGAVDIPKGDLTTNTNRIWSLDPDGTIGLKETIADPPLPYSAPSKNFHPAMIAPGEEVVWKMAAEYFIRVDNLPGVYRVYWDFGGVLSNEIRLLRRPGVTLEGKPIPEKYQTKPKVWASSLIEQVKQFYRGMDGKPNDVTSHLWIDKNNPLHPQVSSLLFQRAMLASRFKDMVEMRFGKDAVNAGWFYESSDPHIIKALEQGTITYPDHFLEAFLEPKGWHMKLHLVRRGTSWKVSADNFIIKGKVDPSLARVNDALKHTAEEIELGKYKSIREAREAMRIRCQGQRQPTTTSR